jgi:hypothetical protein
VSCHTTAVQIELNDEDILSVLRTQGQRASTAHQELTTTKKDIGHFHDTMGQILEEANKTQSKVDVICKDIRAMDYAKKHLTQSISVLENFGTLTVALTDLKESSNDRCALTECTLKSVAGTCVHPDALPCGFPQEQRRNCGRGASYMQREVRGERVQA